MIPRRTLAFAVIPVLVVGFIIGGAVLTVLDLKNEVDKLSEDRSVLAAQLENEGIEPAVPDAEPAAGIPGEKGERGDPGRDGRDGIDGAPGLPGKDGAAGPKGDTGAAGADGIDGVDGSNGADGMNGVDGQPGVDGRGIASQECVEGDYVTTYTDGTTDVIEDSPACPNGPPAEVTVP